MTKLELIKVLESYTDDTEILVYNEWHTDDDEEFKPANDIEACKNGVGIY